jgi:hypothetical protein
MSEQLREASQVSCPPPSNPQDQFSAPLVLEGYLRREELARQLGLSPRTIDRWEALGIGPPRVCVGRTILYKVESVRDWLDSSEGRMASTTKRQPRPSRRGSQPPHRRGREPK